MQTSSSSSAAVNTLDAAAIDALEARVREFSPPTYNQVSCFFLVFKDPVAYFLHSIERTTSSTLFFKIVTLLISFGPKIWMREIYLNTIHPNWRTLSGLEFSRDSTS
jgi:hypothetical protein